MEQEEIRQKYDKESYELMRICRLNRIRIRNPEKWDKAKYDDFIGNRVGTAEEIKHVKRIESLRGFNKIVELNKKIITNTQ